jgi:hypothetical protein
MRYAILITCLLSLGAKPYYGVPKSINYDCPPQTSPAITYRAGVPPQTSEPRPAVAALAAPIVIPDYARPAYMQRTEQVISKAQQWQQSPTGQAYVGDYPPTWRVNRMYRDLDGGTGVNGSCRGGLRGT